MNIKANEETKVTESAFGKKIWLRPWNEYDLFVLGDWCRACALGMFLKFPATQKKPIFWKHDNRVMLENTVAYIENLESKKVRITLQIYIYIYICVCVCVCVCVGVWVCVCVITRSQQEAKKNARGRDESLEFSERSPAYTIWAIAFIIQPPLSLRVSQSDVTFIC